MASETYGASSRVNEPGPQPTSSSTPTRPAAAPLPAPQQAAWGRQPDRLRSRGHCRHTVTDPKSTAGPSPAQAAPAAPTHHLPGRNSRTSTLSPSTRFTQDDDETGSPSRQAQRRRR
jgi:hypothetical protein